jgi:hypothetical protein
MKNYGKLATGLIVAWFIFALSASALYLFKNVSESHRSGRWHSRAWRRLFSSRCGLLFRRGFGSSH